MKLRLSLITVGLLIASTAFAQTPPKRTTDLASATTIADTNEVIINQGPTTKRAMVRYLPFLKRSDSTKFVGTGRTITINGTTLDLSANRSWTIAAGGTVDTTQLATRLYSQALVAGKVDIVGGKQLSTNDFTNPLLTKLNGIATGATANSSDATLLNRANHTGTQAPSTLSAAGASTNQVLTYNGTSWAPHDPTSTATYVDSTLVHVISACDTSYHPVAQTANRNTLTGSSIPTGSYFYEATSYVGNGRKFEGININATGTGNIVIEFMQNVGNVATRIYAETLAVSSTGYQTISRASMSIPDPTFANVSGNVYVAVAALTSGIYNYLTGQTTDYCSYTVAGGSVGCSNGLSLGVSVNYSMAVPIATRLANAEYQLSKAGTINDQAAFIARCAAGGGHIKLGEGVFNLASLPTLAAGTNLEGSGSKTILKATGSTIYVLYVPNDDVTIHDLTIDGGDSSSALKRIASCTALKTDSNAGTRSGIYIYGAHNTVVHDVRFINCNKAGLFTSGAGGGSAPLTNSTVGYNLYFHNDYVGLYSNSEYAKWNMIGADSCAAGASINAGNNHLDNSYFTENASHLHLGPGGGNDAHGHFIGDGFNHATLSIGGVYVENTTLPTVFSGCEFYASNILFENTRGTGLFACQVAGAITATSGAGNRVSQCIFYNSYGGGTFTGTLYRKDNTWLDGVDPSALNN